MSRSRSAFDFVVLSLYPVLTAIILSLWFLPQSRVWISTIRLAVVLFCSIGATSNLFLSFTPDNHPHHRLYLITPIHPGLWLRFLSTTTTSWCVQSRPLLLLSYVHITFFFFCLYPLFIVYIFYDLFSFFLVYTPPSTFVPLILCYPTCTPSRNR